MQSAARAWLERQVLPDNERGRDRHTSARSIAWPKIWLTSIATSPGKRLMMCKPAASDDDRLNAMVASGIIAAVGDIGGSGNRRGW